MADDSNNNRIIPIKIEDEMQDSYLAYAMSVIVSRALPDVRDGLKPVHRRILYFMGKERLFHNNPYKKSAYVVGGVIAELHPHGDASVYDALVRMARDFSLRVPLINGQGNFGSIDGDPPAAYRYTEARLQKIASYLLNDIDKNTVDFRDNYDESSREPVILPAAFPNILVNGSSGVAVGMATNIPPHNLGEVIDGCIAFYKNNDISLEEILSIIPGPDFPTGAQVIGTISAKNALSKGQGIITLRGVSHIEDISSNKKAIIITEIPYQVNKAKMIEDIADLVRDKRIEGITDMRDESNMKGMRVVIELRRDITPEIMLNQLHALTNLQISFGVNMLVLLGQKTMMMSVLEIIKHFCAFRIETFTRKTLFLLQKVREKSHILLGLCVTLNNIDEIVKIIKNSVDTAEARQKLLGRRWPTTDISDLIEILSDDETLLYNKVEYQLTDKQVTAILEMKLQKLTGLEYQKIVNEIKELAEEIRYHQSLLASKQKMVDTIIEELYGIKNEFATSRKTAILPDENFDDRNNIENLVEKEDVIVTVTMNGYIKSTPLSTYKAQSRGGKGRMSQNMQDDDTVLHLFLTTNHDSLLFFSNEGKVYKLKVYKIPTMEPTAKGKALVNFLSLAANETISNIVTYNKEHNNIVFATSQGKVRRSDWSDFHNVPSNGKIAMKLDDENEKLIGVISCADADDILLCSAFGKAIRFSVESLRVIKSRMSSGVKGINLATNDKVVSICTLKSSADLDVEMKENFLKIPVNLRVKIGSDAEHLTKNEENILQENILSREKIVAMAKNEEFLLSSTTNGYGKRTSSYEYRVTNRGGMGIINIITSNRNGNVINTFAVNHNDQIILVANNGMIIRISIENIRIIGRNSKGVKMFDLRKGSQLVSMAKTIATEEKNDE